VKYLLIAFSILVSCVIACDSVSKPTNPAYTGSRPQYVRHKYWIQLETDYSVEDLQWLDDEETCLPWSTAEINIPDIPGQWSTVAFTEGLDTERFDDPVSVAKDISMLWIVSQAEPVSIIYLF
jgi:hypothetical protein